MNGTLTPIGTGFAPSPAHHDIHHRLRIAAVAVLAVFIGLGAWTLANRLTATNANETPVATTAVLPLQSWSVSALQRQLRGAGYAVTVTGVLDPVTKSATADFLLPGDIASLGPSLAGELQGTAITGRRDVAAWNARFGTDRATRMVERPLTGTGGQLDAYGNVSGG